MAYRVWHSPIKSIILQTYEEVVVYYAMQRAAHNTTPEGWEEVAAQIGQNDYVM